MLEAMEDWLIDQEGIPARDVTRLRRHLENRRESGLLVRYRAPAPADEPPTAVEQRIMSLVPADPGGSALYVGCGGLKGAG